MNHEELAEAYLADLRAKIEKISGVQGAIVIIGPSPVANVAVVYMLPRAHESVDKVLEGGWVRRGAHCSGGVAYTPTYTFRDGKHVPLPKATGVQANPSRFQKCVDDVTRKARRTGYDLISARGVCAKAGRRKYGEAGMKRLAAKGRKRAGIGPRGNPTAEIYRWKRDAAGTLVVKYIDVDDGTKHTAPGYVLRVFGATSGSFDFSGAEYKLLNHRWKLAKTSDSVVGTVDLKAGTFQSKFLGRMTPDAKRQLGVILEWLEHEVKEHGTIPHLARSSS